MIDALVINEGRSDFAAPSAAQCAAWIALLGSIMWLSLRGWGDFQVGAFQDDAIYLVLARSLAAGHEYGLINQPGPPPLSKYPFGFPLVLASFGALGTETPAATVIPLGATLLNVTLLIWGWNLLSPTTNRWWGIGVAWLYGVSPRTIGHTRMVMSEPVFLSFVLAGLLLAEAVLRTPRARWRSALLGMMTACAVFTRTSGIALVAAVAVRLGTSRQRIGYAPLTIAPAAAIASLLAVLALTPIGVRHLWPSRYVYEIASNASSTERAPSTVADVPSTHVAKYAFGIRRTLFPIGGGAREQELATRFGIAALPAILTGAMLGLIGLGAWSALRAQALSPSVLLFEAMYLAELMLWWTSDPRLLYPLQPFLAAQLLMGVRALADGARRLLRRPSGATRQPLAVAGIGAVLLAAALAKSLQTERSVNFTRDLRIGTTWLMQHTPANAIVMGRYPPALYLYSDRHTVPLEARNGEELERAFAERHVDYLLLGPALTWREDGALDYDTQQNGLLPAVAEMTARGRLTQVYESAPRDLVRIYRVEPTAKRAE